ncbi:pentapeptide repeat-containing protein [Nostocales cyanobacterium LEGE 11386]|nr:pentapeptide repeat-containing protein [Nostocales cyanobacterium LEGE 11386]
MKFSQDNFQKGLLIKRLQKSLEEWTKPENNCTLNTSKLPSSLSSTNGNIYSSQAIGNGYCNNRQRLRRTISAVQCSEQQRLPHAYPVRDTERTGSTIKYDHACRDRQLHEEIYDLLGNGALTPEIVKQVMDFLRFENKFQPVLLFQRLENFYSRWCRGEFIDALPSDNLPQKKMMALLAQNITIGLRQVDIYTGLNVLILLLELHSYAQAQEQLQQQIIFYPSTKPDTNNFFTSQLLRVINYSDALEIGNFSSIVGEFLKGGNFQGAYLGDANLTGVNFSGANLSGAYLGDANLTGANFSNANLAGANFGDANLSGANFSNADLSNADLSSANLSGANIKDANLYRANLSSTDLSSSNLKDADLCHADLSSANIKDANLSNANFTNAIIFGANLSDANLNGINLSHADLCRADLSGADLSHAILNGTNLSDTILFSTNLSDANLSNADLSYAKLNGADLSDTNLNYAILGGADFSDTNLKAMIWDEKQQWEGVQGLETAVNVPTALKQQLGLV